MLKWNTKNCVYRYFRFEVEVQFSIPNIIVDPTLDVAQTAIQDVANALLEANRSKSHVFRNDTHSYLLLHGFFSQDVNFIVIWFVYRLQI